jgi:hypothetical protein
MSKVYKHIENFFDNIGFELYEYLYNNIQWKDFYLGKSKIYYTSKNIIDSPINQLLINIENILSIKINNNIIINLYKTGFNYYNYNRHLQGLDVYYLFLGNNRDLLIKPIEKYAKSCKLVLKNGDLIIFKSKYNSLYKQSLPLRRKLINKESGCIIITFFRDI